MKSDYEVSLERQSPVVLSVKHVAKSFRLPTEQASGLKMAFLNWTKGIKGYTEQHVLRDITFDVRRGDFFGIVGRNGSGKSTLLKIISQIYVPEQGTVDVRGKLVPFIELGVGADTSMAPMKSRALSITAGIFLSLKLTMLSIRLYMTLICI